jgi:protein-L-isoaspartate(D-aspartate) O-methyltransferase
MDILGTTVKKTHKPQIITESEREAVYTSQFGYNYWDDPHFAPGYRGYHYDGRWKEPAQQLLDHFQVPIGGSVLDVGCGKGFLLYELSRLRPDLDIRGLDISRYAIENSKPEIRDRITLGTATALPFRNRQFDLVICLVTIYHLPEAECANAIQEVERVGKRKLISMLTYRTETERKNLGFDSGRTYKSLEEWKSFYRSVGYTGEASWIVFE